MSVVSFLPVKIDKHQTFLPAISYHKFIPFKVKMTNLQPADICYIFMPVRVSAFACLNTRECMQKKKNNQDTVI